MMWFEQFLFLDRSDAGRQLAEKLHTERLIETAERDALLVLSIPRGGVVVGAAVAAGLGCEHQVVVAKKVGFPGHAELAAGAVAEDGTVIFNEQLLLDYGQNEERFAGQIAQAKAHVAQYIEKFRQGRALQLAGKVVILVDDGIATGETMRAALKWIKAGLPAEQPQQVIVAVPVCEPRTAADLQKQVDRLVCLAQPQWFRAIGQFYWDFEAVDDEQVRHYLLDQTTV